MSADPALATLSPAALDGSSLFFAILTLATNALVLGAVVLAVGGRFSPALAGRRSAGADQIGPSALWLAAGVAVTCTAGSLWFSEVAGFTPCRLCWFQRACMYPLALLLVLAAWKRETGITFIAVPLAVLGMVISAYHYLVEWYPSLESSSCDPSVPCTYVWFRRLGWITLPYMALSGFAAIVVLVFVAHRRPAADPGADDPVNRELVRQS